VEERNVSEMRLAVRQSSTRPDELATHIRFLINLTPIMSQPDSSQTKEQAVPPASPEKLVELMARSLEKLLNISSDVPAEAGFVKETREILEVSQAFLKPTKSTYTDCTA
jgi:hypothetical protein